MRGDGSNSRVLLYGAYGYTGRLAAELAAAKKLDVVLAGRNKDALADLGDRLNLILDCEEPKAAVPSTIVELHGDTWRILREGAIAVAEIEAALA